MKDFKYKATFDVVANLKKKSYGAFEASASVKELEELRSLLPEDKVIAENDDLLFCSFNLAVAGLVNLNNHSVAPETAVQMANYWVHRPINVEHCRDKCVGAVVSSGFSSFPDTKVISGEEALDSKEPFHITIGGVIWKVVDPWLCDYLEYTQNEKDGWLYAKMSSSWELGFNSYHIARGSKNLFTAEIIKDEKEIERLSPYLLQMGGSGFDDKNVECYMVIAGEARPLGVGLTSNPAAPVKGIYIPEIKENPDKDDEKMEKEDKKEEKAKKSEKIISPNKKITVKHVDMKFKDIDEFCDKYAEASSKQEVFAASDVRSFIKESVEKEGEKWQVKLEEKEAVLATALKKSEDLQAAVDIAKEDGKKTQDELETLRKELQEIRVQAEKAEKTSVFQVRMSELDEKYELSDKVRKVVTKSIMGQSDEEYASWLENEGEVILSGKEKKVPETPEDALKDVKANKEFVPNAGDGAKTPTKLNPSVKTEGKTIEISL